MRGARGRRMRPVLIAGNVVHAQLSARTDTQLPQAAIELVHSRGPLLSEPLPAAAIEWATVLTATVLPEGQPYPRLYKPRGVARSDRGGAVGERVGRGARPLRAAAARRARLRPRPRSLRGHRRQRRARRGEPQIGPSGQRRRSRALCRKAAAAAAVHPRGRSGSWEEMAQGLDLTGHFLLRDLLTERSRPIAEARARLVDRLRRAGGLA